jgi:hypothetical protein
MLKDIRKKDAVSTQIYIGSRVVAQKKKIFEKSSPRLRYEKPEADRTAEREIPTRESIGIAGYGGKLKI